MTEREWQILYMKDALPNGKKGVEPAAFYRPSGKYTLIDNDTTTGVGITPDSSSVTPPAPQNFYAKSYSDTHISFGWDAVPKASGYQLVRFRAADHKDIAVSFDIKSTQNTALLGPYSKGIPFYYGVRAVYSQNGETLYSDWTYLTFIHAGVGITYGDIDNNGVFNMADLSLLIKMYANKDTLDQRTLSAAGVSGKDHIVMSDISALIKAYTNRT